MRYLASQSCYLFQLSWYMSCMNTHLFDRTFRLSLSSLLPARDKVSPRNISCDLHKHLPGPQAERKSKPFLRVLNSSMSEIGHPHPNEGSKDDSKPSENVQETVDPTDPTLLDSKQKHIRQNIEEFEQLFGVDEEAYHQPTTTKKELWSYYLYYNGQCCIQCEILG